MIIRKMDNIQYRLDNEHDHYTIMTSILFRFTLFVLLFVCEYSVIMYSLILTWNIKLRIPPSFENVRPCRISESIRF